MIEPTRTRSTRRSRGGFTLIEIVVVLFIIALLLGAFIPMTSGLFQEERLRKPARELQIYAKTARRLALLRHQPFAVELRQDGFSIFQRNPGEKDALLDSSTNASATPIPEETEYDYALPGDVTVLFQPWGATEWIKPSGEAWVFQPNGLCEPIRVRLERGDAWMEFTFNPLTANPQDEAFYFP